tara:strand:+ start:2066 stop:2500 length:435 start_codon:yes stop_codon:yes gene_type:complete
MIECTLMGMKKYSDSLGMVASDNKIKFGKYSGSIYHSIPGFGKKNWVVIVNIDVNYGPYISTGVPPEDVVAQCITYLNTPPKSKYGKRRKRKPLFGTFRNEPYRYSLKERDGKKYIQAHLVVEKRKQRHFWGEGEQISVGRRKK